MKRTVFVVGAGGSTEFGLGVGADLAKDIAVLLRHRVANQGDWLNDHSHSFDLAVRQISADAAQIVRASEVIRRGLPYSNSVDDFLHENRDDQLVVHLGKLAIAHCMLIQEQRAGWLKQLGAPAIESRAEASANLRGTWLDQLFRILKRGHTREEARSAFDKIGFITFNYDRCIEQYLYCAIGDAFALDPEDARSVADSVQIEHVYGSLGVLPVQNKERGLPFAAERSPLPSVASGIRTYTEEVSDTSRAIIRGLLNDAEQVVFLGYAFHEQGLNLLFPAAVSQKKYVRVFFTHLGVHDAVLGRFTAKVNSTGKLPANSKCVEAIANWQFDLLKA